MILLFSRVIGRKFVRRAKPIILFVVWGTHAVNIGWFSAPIVRAEDFAVAKSPSEYGFGLSKDDAQKGWIALFDGLSGFGWSDAKVESGVLDAGKTSTRFVSGLLRGESTAAGELLFGDRVLSVPQGEFEIDAVSSSATHLILKPGLRLKRMAFRPLKLRPIFDGKSLEGWSRIRHSELPSERQAKWRIDERTIRAIGGPGAIEYRERYDDFFLQVAFRCRKELVNAGIFFRAVPGEFLNGYEAQVFNACEAGDAARPVRFSTGAIDDRQHARRLVSRDNETTVMTIVADGRHLSTWVNGYQVVDWIDTRANHPNPRIGCSVNQGVIQLQAHDQQTDIEFLDVSITDLF
jgi:hypothetical protein